MKKLVGIAFVGMMALGCGGGSKGADTNTAANPPPAADPAAAPAQTDPAAAPAQAPAPAQN